MQKIFSVFFPSIEFLGVIATGAVLYFGDAAVRARDAHDRDTDHRDLPPAARLPAAAGALGRLRPAAVRRAAMVKIASILDEEPDIKDRPGATPSCRASTATSRSTVRLRLRQGAGAERRRRSTCGRAAASRSSASRAAASRRSRGSIGRYYDPDEGAVRVDGHDLRGVELRSYRRQLGVVLQDPFLFSGTIASNIRFGKPDATDDEVEAAAAAVGVDRVAARLSGGLDHEVREGGCRPVGRRAPADLDRASAARRPADPHPRRGDLEHRPADRGADRAGARPAAARAAPRSSSRTARPPSAAPTRSS